jgi:hypothetical protein
MMQFVERWRRRIEWRWMIVQAVFYLLAARLALAVVPFRRLTWFFERPARQPEVIGQARIHLRKQVRGAIIYAYRRVLFGRATCFHRGMAAQVMLRHRGVGTTLYYGAARLPGHGLSAHVWVQDGEEGVMGCLVAQQNRFGVLARYPDIVPTLAAETDRM